MNIHWFWLHSALTYYKYSYILVIAISVKWKVHLFKIPCLIILMYPPQKNLFTLLCLFSMLTVWLYVTYFRFSCVCCFRSWWYEAALLCGSVCVGLLFPGHGAVTSPTSQGPVFSLSGSCHVVSQHIQSRRVDALRMRKPMVRSAAASLSILVHVFSPAPDDVSRMVSSSIHADHNNLLWSVDVLIFKIPLFPVRRQQRLRPGPLVETGWCSRSFLCTRGSDTSEDGLSE